MGSKYPCPIPNQQCPGSNLWKTRSSVSLPTPFVRTPMEPDGLLPLASRLTWDGVLVSGWIRS